MADQLYFKSYKKESTLSEQDITRIRYYIMRTILYLVQTRHLSCADKIISCPNKMLSCSDKKKKLACPFPSSAVITHDAIYLLLRSSFICVVMAQLTRTTGNTAKKKKKKKKK